MIYVYNLIMSFLDVNKYQKEFCSAGYDESCNHEMNSELVIQLINLNK